MLQVSNLKLSLQGGMDELRKKTAHALGVPLATLPQLTLFRQSIDARRKSQVCYVCTVRCALPNEEKVLKNSSGQVTIVQERPYTFPPVRRRSALPPVVVGMGPAGLFAALHLAQAGLPPIILERGRPVEERAKAVEAFWSTGLLDENSNVQFGEGGAGAFSDGKLQTGIHDPRVAAVLETFVRFGGPEDLLYAQKPHVGTDLLRRIMVNLRQKLLELGCDIRFSHTLTGLKPDKGRIAGVEVTCPQGKYDLPCDALILAPGHSARDTFALLQRAGIPMEPKPFAVGVRIEHRQDAISQAQYGSAWELLPPSDYKLSCHLPSGRGVFSFCVCPGGQVVASSSEEGTIVTNGMSFRARDGVNINGGLLVGVNPSDFTGSDPLAGFSFQRKWEKLAFQLGGGGCRAPCQNVGSFLTRGVPSLDPQVTPTYRPGVTPAALERCLPDFVTASLREALPLLGRRLRGFDHPAALLTGVETRSSSPVRILRDPKTLQSVGVQGLYPCGEGAGWAGGITSAAVDGIKAAEAVASWA